MSTPGEMYTGTLEIDSDWVTIRGYDFDQTPSPGNDYERPFKDFIKGFPLEWYSGRESIFIEDGG